MAVAIDITKRYTYADYLTWLDDTRRELIDGFIKLFPAPHFDHARVSKNIYKLLSFMETENCEYEVFYAPVSVVLSDIDVVEPDIFICERGKLIDGRCIGAPVLIIEILSQFNKKNDLITKFQLYEKYGVQEYWIVNPKAKTVFAYTLQNNEYDDGEEYIIGETVTVKSLGNFTIDVRQIFLNL
jgi:Uma2 family endonuclease